MECADLSALWWVATCRDRRTFQECGAKPPEAKAWLKQFGDPYILSISDQDGRVGLDYGVYGVPETFVIDRAGIIRYKQIGPVTREALEGKILPLVRQLQKS